MTPITKNGNRSFISLYEGKVRWNMLNGRKRMAEILAEKSVILNQCEELMIEGTDYTRLIPNKKRLFNERQSRILNEGFKIILDKIYEYGYKKSNNMR